MLNPDVAIPPPEWFFDHVLREARTRPWDGFWDGLAAELKAGTRAERVAAAQGFVLTRAAAAAAGTDPAAQRRLLYGRHWWHPRR